MEDKITILNKRLKIVKEKFDALKLCGMDNEILEIYLQHKTKLSKKDVKLLLKCEEEFFHRLIKKNILENLEKDK